MSLSVIERKRAQASAFGQANRACVDAAFGCGVAAVGGVVDISAGNLGREGYQVIVLGVGFYDGGLEGTFAGLVAETTHALFLVLNLRLEMGPAFIFG